MKHSKMFKMLIAGLAVAAMASTTFAAIDVSDSFESYSDGADIGTNNAGWYAEADVALATTSNNPTGYYAGYPITNANHTVTMAFDGTVSNSLNGVLDEGVYVDFLVQPTLWDEDTAPAVPTNSQIAMYFDTNGYANIYHTYQEVVSPWPVTQKWSQITSVDVISTGDWVRVTYQMFYDNYSIPERTYFKLWINGEAASSPSGFTDDTFTVPNGVYFMNADCDGGNSPGARKIRSFTAKGAGTLDDFVVTNGAITPFVDPTDQWDVTTSDGLGGEIDPDGVTAVNDGEAFSATVTADMNYLIESVKYFTNSAAITNYFEITNDTVQVVTIDPVLTNMTIEATFTNAIITEYTIAITNLTGFGDVVPGTDTNVPAGSDLTVVVTPNTGYAADITVDGTNAVDAVFTDIQEAHVVLVDFILGDVPSSNSVDVASSWLQDYGLALTTTNANLYWEAYLADINPTSGVFEIISATVVDGTNYIKWISEGLTPTLPPFVVLGTDDLTNGWTSVDTVTRPSTFTTNEFIDATKTYYKVNATDGN
ncbi:MAG: hypothetical protein PF692_03590 [Kiritimatiellae bacterium]|jgi:hypothetical protein|nr:hypothetical protein [Kiritimatiellia bacterium]